MEKSHLCHFGGVNISAAPALSAHLNFWPRSSKVREACCFCVFLTKFSPLFSLFSFHLHTASPTGLSEITRLSLQQFARNMTCLALFTEHVIIRVKWQLGSKLWNHYLYFKLTSSPLPRALQKLQCSPFLTLYIIVFSYGGFCCAHLLAFCCCGCCFGFER